MNAREMQEKNEKLGRAQRREEFMLKLNKDKEKDKASTARQQHILSKAQAAQQREGKAFMEGLTTDFQGFLMVSQLPSMIDGFEDQHLIPVHKFCTENSEDEENVNEEKPEIIKNQG